MHNFKAYSILTVLVAALLVILAIALGPTQAEYKDRKFFSQVLSPSVCIQTSTFEDSISGSGTVVHSSPEKGTYVITAYHVIDDKKDKLALVKFPVYDDPDTRLVWRDYINYQATVVAVSEIADLALLKLNRNVDLPSATVMVDNPSHMKQGSEIFNVGCPLGRNPYVNPGLLNSQRQVNWKGETAEYFMNTSGTIFGNSGGAVFMYNEDTRQFEIVGVSLAVSTAPIAEDTLQLMTHMSYTISYTEVLKLMKEADIG